MNPSDRAAMLVATGLGTGHLRPASGTWGSALGLLLYLPLARLNQPHLWWAWGLVLVAGSLIGIWAASIGERVTGEKDSHDIVIDEIVGQWVALSFAPMSAGTGLITLWGWSAQSLFVLAAAFLLFRAFDVWKPYPIRQLQRLRGGLGVMIDDLLAGAWACVILHAGLALGRAAGLWG
jgi:phosphatidylglycerophosphatase A